ncbi:MAG: HDOD domain-containing protein [Phycisphaerae bacterium]|nr:HDOD domain-containing protein [Phycisphaerae bacterium]
MSIRTIDEIVEQVHTLPRLQDTALRLIEVVRDPSSSIEQIVATIQYDQVVTAQILRLCNSAYFGMARQVSSIGDAVRFLGTSKLLQLAMAAHTQTLLGRAQTGYGLPPNALWLHSVGVAIGAPMFAHRFGVEHEGLIFTAGLLHDVGKIVLNEYVASEYAEIARIVSTTHSSFLEAEQQVLGLTHPEVGSRIAEEWNLPTEIVDAIRYHHEADSKQPASDLIDAVALADSVCRLAGVGCGYDGMLYRADVAVMERHQLVESDLERVSADMVLQLKSVQKLFGAGRE